MPVQSPGKFTRYLHCKWIKPIEFIIAPLLFHSLQPVNNIIVIAIPISAFLCSPVLMKAEILDQH